MHQPLDADLLPPPEPNRRLLLTRLAIAGLPGGFIATPHAAPDDASARSEPPPPFNRRAEVQAFLARMQRQYGLDANWLDNAFAGLRPNPRVLALISPTPGGAPQVRRRWSEYRAQFLDPVRIRAGQQFMHRYRTTLARAEAQYGVPVSIIAAILGIETVYGRNTGSFPTLQALATLAFDFPARSPYFTGELEQFLLYARDNGVLPRKPTGSYAGALGIPQFMPTSLRRFAVDFDGDGRIDLKGSPVDALGSVARFLEMHGWQRGLPTHYRATVDDLTRIQPALDAGPEANLLQTDLARWGIRSPDSIPADQKLLLIDLPEGDDPPMLALGTANFYTITRYNRSFFYAMAVVEVAAALTAEPPPSPASR